MHTPEEVYREFFRADSARDAQAWANVMSYPHVRVSADGRVHYFETAADYAASASWTARAATGWVRSEGVEPERVHASDDMVHLAGGWTRHNAAGEPILENRVAYLLTRLDGAWGIQARFACGAAFPWRTVDDPGPVETVRQYCEALQEADHDRGAGLIRYPLTLVGVGTVRRFEDAAAFGRTLGTPAGGAPPTVRMVENGRVGATVAATSGSDPDERVHTLFLVGKHAGSCRIVAMSTLP